MKEIYLVITSEGEYEDYFENIERAYTSKEAAEKYAKELNHKYDFITPKVIENYQEAEEYVDMYANRNPDLFKNPYTYKDNREKYLKELDLINKRMDAVLLDYLNKTFGYSFTQKDIELIMKYMGNPYIYLAEIQTITLYEE